MEMNDEILIKFLLKETSVNENAIVQEWLLQGEANANHFAAIEKIWIAGEALALKSELDTEQAWEKFKHNIAAQQVKPPVIKSLKKNYTWLKIAAVLVMAIGAWSTYTWLGPTSYTRLVSQNEVLSQVLPDGSELTINKNTQVSYAGNFKNNRSVRLAKGEVFFKVAHNRAYPFVIEIANVKVQVVGTSFNIKHLKDETEVVVETGIVKVRLQEQEIQLVKGERLVVNADTKKLEKVQSNDQLYNYYRTKLFIAQNTPLPELIEILNEAYHTNIVLNDKAKQLTIYTTLEFGSLSENLKNICDALSLKISRNQKQILLSYP